MRLKERLLSNMFFRNMLSDLFGRGVSSTEPGRFIPYFQYKIGPYQPDHYLYFPSEPYATRYKNEIFNKLNEYTGYDIITYLDFHYTACADRHDFLRFLQYEIADRLKRVSRKSHFQKLTEAGEWVREKQQELQAGRQIAIRQELEQGVRELFPDGRPGFQGEGFDKATRELTRKLSDYMDEVITQTEERMEALTGSFVTGNIELNNQQHLESLIQVFKILQSLQTDRGEQVFKRFSDTDIASILRLHFEPFKNKKINTLQVKIREGNERLNYKNPKVKKLSEALQDYFS